MKPTKSLISLILLLSAAKGIAQYQFDGYVNYQDHNSVIYLSVVEDFRKISGVFPEQILAKKTIDTSSRD